MNSSLDWPGLAVVVAMLVFLAWLLRRALRTPGRWLLKGLLLSMIVAVLAVMLWNTYVALVST